MIGRILIGLGVFLIVVLIGGIVQIVDIAKKTKRRNFIVGYEKYFIEYAQNNDQQIYDKLVKNLYEAQTYLGRFGFVSGCKPYEALYRDNEPVLILLHDIKQERKLGSDKSGCYIDLILDTIKIAIGNYDYEIKETWKKVKNLFVDFYKGFNFIIVSPFIILSYTFTGKNIFSSHVSRPIRILGRITSFILQMIGVSSGLLTIILGYSDFVNLVKSWF